MKPENWISATGFSPAAAMPTATPPIASSASGVSITRSGPKRSSSPCVARNTPPFTPTSSPSTTTLSSSAIACARAMVTALTRVVSGMVASLARRRDRRPLADQRRRQLSIEMVEHRFGLRPRRRQVALDRVVDLAIDLVDQALLVGLGPDAGLAQEGAQAGDRVVRPLFAQNLAVAIAAGVVGGGM